MTESRPATLLQRYPVLRKLDRRFGRKTFPFVGQLQVTDCGAACIAMVLGYHGREVRVDQVRDALRSSRDGVSMLQMLEAAGRFGLRGRGIRLELHDVEHLRPGTILHWDLRHFVVFEKFTRRGVWILDPSSGRYRLPLEAVGMHFTGAGLELEPTEDMVRSSQGPHRSWRYLALLLGRTDLLRRIAVTSLLIQCLTMAVPIFTGALVDQVVPRADYNLLAVLCAGLVAMTLFGFLAQLVRGYVILQLRTDMDIHMTTDLVEHLLRVPFSFFQTRPAGDLTLRLASMNSIREILTSNATSIALDGVLVIGYLVLLLFLNPLMGGLVLLLSGIRFALFFVTWGPNKRLMASSLQAQASSGSFQVQMIQGIETLKSCGAEARVLERWSHLFANVMNNSVQRGRLALKSDSFLQAMNVLSPAVVLGVGGFLVLRQNVSLGTMLAINALAAAVLGPLGALITSGMQAQALGSYIDRVEDILRTEVEQSPKRSTKPIRLRGGVQLERVSFRYDESSPYAVQDVSLEIEPGRMVAIVGPSGSGKSTLARLLLALYKPTDGILRLDEVPLVDCDLTQVRQQIGFVPQTNHFFDASIRENIALSDPDASLEDIERAARLAVIHEDIQALPLQYDTPMVADGGTMSGGQRQRVALARALLTRPKLLILDEATSHLDAVTERRVYESLEGLQCTRIVIAHRLSTIATADRIFVMESGRLVEQGGHQDLMSAGGAYASLVLHQVDANAHGRVLSSSA